MKQLAVDLVILNERHPPMSRTFRSRWRHWCAPASRGRRSGEDVRAARVFVLRADLIPAETRALLLGRAGGAGGAARQPARPARPRSSDASVDTAVASAPATSADAAHRDARRGARASNSSTGSAASREDGQEYVTILGPASRRRRPGSMSSPTRLSASRSATEGSGYTWAVNSRENQLTPWSNDPVSDRPGEAFYLRDEDTGDALEPDRAADPRSKRRPISPGTAAAIAGSRMPRTASRSSCCNTCRSTTRSRSRA